MITPVIVFEIDCDLCARGFDFHSDEPHWTGGMLQELEWRLAASEWWRSRGGRVHVCSWCVQDKHDAAARAMASDGGRVEMDPY